MVGCKRPSNRNRSILSVTWATTRRESRIANHGGGWALRTKGFILIFQPPSILSAFSFLVFDPINPSESRVCEIITLPRLNVHELQAASARAISARTGSLQGSQLQDRILLNTPRQIQFACHSPQDSRLSTRMPPKTASKAGSSGTPQRAKGRPAGKSVASPNSPVARKTGAGKSTAGAKAGKKPAGKRPSNVQRMFPLALVLSILTLDSPILDRTSPKRQD